MGVESEETEKIEAMSTWSEDFDVVKKEMWSKGLTFR